MAKHTIKFRLTHWFCFAFTVSILTLLLADFLPMERGEPKNHAWVKSGIEPSIDEMLANLSKGKWLDLNPGDLEELADQLRDFCPVRVLPLKEELDPLHFRKAFRLIEKEQSLDRGLLALLHHLDLDIAASDGTLEIGSHDDSRLAMVRIYNVPEVESQELISTLESFVESGHWMSAGGDSNMSVVWNQSRTRCKLIIQAPRRTHCKVEGMIALLVKSYGWKRYQFSNLFSVTSSPMVTATPTVNLIGNGCFGL